ncbi:MAG TPA: enoyl-CoA hydratase-related protein [Bryobacteraceae bacterium]|nr:enoyl-CoA hydratase-related protein [Bryobacteraceae bacterium]
MADYTTILVEETEVEAGRILTITLNRPQRRNALTSCMIHELTLALRAAEDSRAGVVVLRGAGEHFCSGLDLSELRAMSSRTTEQHQRDSMNIAELFRTLYSLSIPSIAEVRGFALAGGMGLATLCDFTLAGDDARLGYTEVKIGFVPAIVSSFLLLQVGEKQARDLLLTGRILDATEARTLGLISRIVPAAELDAAVSELSTTLLANSPSSMRATKHLLHRQEIERLSRNLRAAVNINAELRATDDFREGVTAFLEKRKPVWPSRS